MGSAITSLCSHFNPDKPEKSTILVESLMQRQVRAEVIPNKKHLTRVDSVLEKSILAQLVIAPKYDFLEEIGNGAYGQVQKASLKANTMRKRLFAVKTVDKSQFQKEIRRFVREIEILKNLDHRNIIRFVEAYESKDSFHIIQEYCGGGDLAKQFELHPGGFPEDIARQYMWQILLALNYIHCKGIAHRDIKPENFLIVEADSMQIKLIDFGLSATINSTYETIKETVGTTLYIAPEVLEQDYTPLCDIWSAGVIFYNLITCRFPFDAETNDKIFELVKTADYDKTGLDTSGYSPEALDLLSKMLRREQDGRISASDALRHPWFHQIREGIRGRGEKLLTKEFLDNLRSYGYSTFMQQEMVSILVQETDHNSEEIKKNYDLFCYIDEDLSGTISAKEIEAVYTKFGIKLKEGEIEAIIDSLYFKEKALVTYLEFIAATLDREFYQNKQRIRELFNYMDVDLSGEIDYKDIQDCFKRFGRLLDDSKIKRMIGECDNNRDEKISFDAFYDIIVAERKRLS